MCACIYTQYSGHGGREGQMEGQTGGQTEKDGRTDGLRRLLEA